MNFINKYTFFKKIKVKWALLNDLLGRKWPFSFYCTNFNLNKYSNTIKIFNYCNILIWNQKRYYSYLELFTNFYFKFINLEQHFVDLIIVPTYWIITFNDLLLTFNDYEITFLFKILKTTVLSSSDISAINFNFYDDEAFINSLKNYYFNVEEAELNYKYFIERDNLPADFFLWLKKKELDLDRQIKDILPNNPNWLFGWPSHWSHMECSYDENDFFPFFINKAYIDFIQDHMSWWNLAHIWQKSELFSYYYDNLFYFIRDVSEWRSVEQIMIYDSIILMMHRNLIFEDWIKAWDPYNFIFGDEKYWFFFSDFWWYQHKKLVKPLLSIYFWQTINYTWLLQSLDNTYFRRIMDIDDPSVFNFDKQFNYTWNLLRVSLGKPDPFERYRMLGTYYNLLEDLINPLVLYQNKFVMPWNTYNLHWSKVLTMTIFPDICFGLGYNNSTLEYFTPDYHWLYYSAGTYMDSLELLEIWREQSYVVSGCDFEDFVTDFIVAGFIYYPEMSCFARCGLMFVAALPLDWLDNEAHFIRCFTSYINFFNLDSSEEYLQMTEKKRLKKLYWWKPLRRLKYFWDDTDFSEWSILSERWVGCMYGYNTSEDLSNYPGWYSTYTNSTNILELMAIDSQNEVDLNNIETWLISTKWNFNLKGWPFLSEFITDWTAEDYFIMFNVYGKLINENYFDEVGYFLSSLIPGEQLTLWNFVVSFLDFFPLLYSKIIPYIHLSWNYYYSLGWPLYIVIHDLLHEWGKVPIDIIIKWFLNYLREFFVVDWDYTLCKTPHIIGYKHGLPLVAYSHNTHFDVYFSFWIWIDKIVGLFIDPDVFLNSNFFYPIHCILYHDWCITEIITEEEFFFYLRQIWEFLTNDRFIITLYGNEYIIYYYISIFDILLKDYFIFLDKVLLSTEFIFLKNMFNYYITINHYRCGITVAGSKYFPYWIACLDFYDCSDWPFDLSFWLPFLIWPKTDYLVLTHADIDQPLGVTFGRYFVDEEYTDEEYYMKYIYSLGQVEAVAFDLSLDYQTLNFLLDLTYGINSNLTFAGFERYYNYVLKETMYHPIPTTKQFQKKFNFDNFFFVGFSQKFKINLEYYLHNTIISIVDWSWNDFYLTFSQIQFFVDLIYKFDNFFLSKILSKILDKLFTR